MRINLLTGLMLRVGGGCKFPGEAPLVALIPQSRCINFEKISHSRRVNLKYEWKQRYIGSIATMRNWSKISKCLPTKQYKAVICKISNLCNLYVKEFFIFDRPCISPIFIQFTSTHSVLEEGYYEVYVVAFTKYSFFSAGVEDREKMPTYRSIGPNDWSWESY